MTLNYLLSLLTLLVMLSCNTAQKAQTPVNTTVSSPTPSKKPAEFITWDKTLVDLGAVKKGEKRNTFFEFTNTSGGDIQIDIVDACECTKVEFPRGVIPPGGKGRLDVTFDSTEKDASETIGINVVFKQTDAAGNPRIKVVEYKYELIK